MTIPRWFLDLPAGRKMLGQQQKQRLAERQVHVDAIAELERRKETELPPLRKAADAKFAAYKKAEEATAEAAREYNEAKSKTYSLTTTLDHQQSQHRGALRDSADPKVVELISDAGYLSVYIRHSRDPGISHRMNSLRDLAAEGRAALEQADDSAILPRLQAAVNSAGKITITV